MSYSFQPFLDAVRGNWYEDDALLHRLVARFADLDDDDEASLLDWGHRVAGPLREWAEESALPSNAPRLRPWDAYGRRVDEIVLPSSTRKALSEVEGRERLGAVHGDPFVFYARSYLYVQNGEAGVGCSLGCTDGMVRVLEALGDQPIHDRAIHDIRESTPERFRHGAQFVTEVQGGSDVPANQAEARRDGDAWRIHGTKWFCSNINADWFLVTAQAEGQGLGLFLAPARLEGETVRNGHTVNRLKEKLGTRELATAEVTFHGALAWPVGPLEKGLSNLVRHVLVTSRFYCVLIAAASLRRARRIVDAYTSFRSAFGRTLDGFPLVRATLDRIRSDQERALACTFGLVELRERAAAAGPRSREDLDFRVLVSLCKPVVTRSATEALHEAMMLLGGNGIEERFSPLPRLFRDAVIMETWEGPHDVLVTQALRDLRRFEVDPADFLERTTEGAAPELVDRLASVVRGDDEVEESAVVLRRLAPEMVRGFAAGVLAQL